MGGSPPLTTDASSRSSRLARGVVTGVLTRLLSVLTPLLVIPIAFERLGEDGYGVWATILGITSMMLWADLGLGNGLLTRLSGSVARHDWQEARGLISLAYLIVGGLALLALALLWLAYLLLPWGALLNATSDETAAIAVVTLAAFWLNVPLSLVLRVQFAIQEVARANLLAALGPLLSLCGAVVAACVDAGPVTLVLLVSLGAPIASVIATIDVGRRHRELVPRFGDARQQLQSGLVQLGGAFLAVQFLSSVALNADNLIVARVLNAAAVAEFSIVARLFLVVGVVITAANLPLWPSNVEALARGDLEWVRRTTRRMVFINAGATLVAALGAVLLLPVLIPIWIGEGVVVSTTLVASFGLFWLAVGVAAPLFMVQNAVGVLAYQLVGWGAYLVVSIPLKAGLAAQHLDLVPAVGFVAYALVVIPSAVAGYRRSLTSTCGGTS